MSVTNDSICKLTNLKHVNIRCSFLISDKYISDEYILQLENLMYSDCLVNQRRRDTSLKKLNKAFFNCDKSERINNSTIKYLVNLAHPNCGKYSIFTNES